MIKSIKKHRRKIIVLIIPLIFICLINIIGNSRWAMSNLPKGDYLSSVDSLNGEYTLNAYLYDCGATCSFSVRVELVNNIIGKVENIYWCDRESEAIMKWINDDVVEINGKKLNIGKGEFCNDCK